MSRSGYSDDCEQWDLIRWRGAVNSAIRGKRGQKFLRDLLPALDAMPNKRLIDQELEMNGEVCALGCIGKARGIDMSGLDPYDRNAIAKTFGIAGALAAEIAYENDDGGWWRHDTPEDRWLRVREWVANNIIPLPL